MGVKVLFPDPAMAYASMGKDRQIFHSSAMAAMSPSHLFDSVVVLDRLPEGNGDGEGDSAGGDELFLLPESILSMDSASFREDVASVAPSLLRQQNNSPHNSLDSTDSARSLRLADDTEGLRLARASDGCKTLWLCKWCCVRGGDNRAITCVQSVSRTDRRKPFTRNLQPWPVPRWTSSLDVLMGREIARLNL